MLEITNHGKVREIRLARPPVNALNPELVAQLSRSFREAEADCEAVVLSGLKGIFSAGLDVIELLQFDREDMTNFWIEFMELLETIACSAVPVAVAITGHSPAGGAVICLMADYRVMSHGKYKIGLNETRVGLVLPPLLQDALSRLVGPRVAEKMLVAGSMIGPEYALEIGFVDALESSHEETVINAVRWCEDLLALPRHSMLGTRAIARAHFKQAFANIAYKGVETFIDTWFADEAQSVMNSVVAKLKGKG
jgi:enoyl-CoA hydratase/carnithine racemase